MKKKRLFAKRVLGTALAMGLMVSALAGCGKNSSGDGNLLNQAGKVNKNYVFKSEELDLGDTYEYNSLKKVGDRIYAISHSQEGQMIIKSFDSDGSNQKTITIPVAYNQSYGYMTFDKDGNFYSVLQIYSGMEDEDVHLMDAEEGDGVAHAGDDEADAATDAAGAETTDAAALESSDAATEAESVVDTDPEEQKRVADYDTETVDEDKQYLVKLDNTGKELFRLDLEEDVPEGEYFYMYSMIYTEEYGLITSSNKGVRSFDDDTKTFKTIVDTSNPDNEFYDMTLTLYNGFNGKTYVSFWGNDGMELRNFDPSTGKFGEPSSQFENFADYSIFEGSGYDLYVAQADGVYGYDANKDIVEKIFDYSDSDLNVSYSLSTIVAISDLEFIANIPDEENNYVLCRLTKVPADQVKERTIITLAGSMMDYNVRQNVYKFNKNNDDYKIKVIDYSKLNTADDWNAGYNQFNMDIVSGNAPDIMFFYGEEPVDSYINKGLFIDLTTYLRNDPELKDTKFVDSAFNAFKTGDKIYQMVPSFTVNTVSAKTSLLRGKETLTLKECQDMIEGMGVSYLYAFGMTSRETILEYGLMSSGDKYIDWENKSCNFNSDDFIQFLEFVKKFPAEITDDMWQDYDDQCYMKDEALFENTYLNAFRSYRRTMDGTFGADISFIGFPNDMGVNFSVIRPSYRLCISSKSKYADACWEFIRDFYKADYQDELTYEFPIVRSSFEKQGIESKDKPYWTDGDGVKHYEDDYVYTNSGQIKINSLSDKDVEFVTNFIDSLTLVESPNKNVNNIIMEEASAFFEGQKSAREVADIIQSRLTIYVNENS